MFMINTCNNYLQKMRDYKILFSLDIPFKYNEMYYII